MSPNPRCHIWSSFPRAWGLGLGGAVPHSSLGVGSGPLLAQEADAALRSQVQSRQLLWKRFTFNTRIQTS